MRKGENKREEMKRMINGKEIDERWRKGIRKKRKEELNEEDYQVNER